MANDVSIQRVVFTGNVLRFSGATPFRTTQISNIRWIKELLSPIFDQHFALHCDALYWDLETKFDSSRIYDAHKENMTQSGYASLLASAPNDDACRYMEGFVRNALIVGFELPDYLVKVFQRIGLQYVDLVLSPLRFLPDLVVGIRTNNPTWFQRINERRLTADAIWSYAGLMKAKLARRRPLGLKEDSCLFAGQVSGDVSLISEGRFLQLAEFADPIEKMSSNHATLYYKEHPYAKLQDKKALRCFFSQFDNAVKIDHNIYQILVQEELKSVCALTSSVIQEAKYFGKHSVAFAQYPFRYAEDGVFDPFSYITIYDELLQPDFWTAIIDGRHGPRVAFPPAVLRDSLGMTWGAELENSSKSRGWWNWGKKWRPRP